VEKGESLLVVDGPNKLLDLKISGDGSRIFCLGVGFIQAISIKTGEVVGRVDVDTYHLESLAVDGSRVWVCNSISGCQGWDFGTIGSPPVQLPNTPANKLHPVGILLWDTSLSRVKNTLTGRVVFQLPKRYEKPADVQWDDWYLVVCFTPTKVLILDFSSIL